MRSSDIRRTWKDIEGIDFKHYVERVNLNGITGIQSIDMSGGIFAICGLNGAGKTTIISALKMAFGLTTDVIDEKKIKGRVDVVVEWRGTKQELSNEDQIKFVDIDGNDGYINYFDYRESEEILKFFSQDNLNDLLDGYEEITLEKSSLDHINYIIGKNYDKVELIEIEDSDKVYPFFKVTVAGEEYTSITMGNGEHFIFYMYWYLEIKKRKGIIIIEEPETFISIYSQQKLMDFIAMITKDRKLTVILSTHSPHIIKNIKKENIRIVTRLDRNVSVVVPESSTTSLETLGLTLRKKGCFFVEDFVASQFLKIILTRERNYLLNDYSIEYVGSESKITSLLEVPKNGSIDFDIIGVYDGDMFKKINRNKKNWNYYFLPTKKSIEEELKEISRKYVKDLSRFLRIKENKVIMILSRIQGNEPHDWFLDLANGLQVNITVLMDKLYSLWKKDKSNKNRLSYFLSKIEEIET